MSYLASVLPYLFAVTMMAQPLRIMPTWTLSDVPSIQHHASADLISVQNGDSLTFIDVWTGTKVASRLSQGQLCFVDSTRKAMQWFRAGNDVIFLRSPYASDDTAIPFESINMDALELKAGRWLPFSSSASNVSYIHEAGGVYSQAHETVQARVFITTVKPDTFTVGMDGSAYGRVAVSRSGRLFGGHDSGETIENPMTPYWKVSETWDYVRYTGLTERRYIPLKNQTQVWLDDVDDFLISTGGIYKVFPHVSEYRSDSVQFLRPLPSGWYWHAPFADWTYALACKSDSSQVSIVSLVTDSVVAVCVPTSQHIDTIYSDVQRNYIITYDKTARVLSGFVVDSTLLPNQVISSVANEDAMVSTGKGARDLGLWPNPSSDVVHLALDKSTTAVAITSLLGERKIVPVQIGMEFIELSLTGVAEGIYVVEYIGDTTPRATPRLLHVIR